MDDHTFKEISITTFEATVNGKGRFPSWQRTAIEAMAAGTAIIISHNGLVCKPIKTGTGQNCSMARMISVLNRKSLDKQYKSSHAPGGDFMVACYAREEDGK